MGLFDFMTQDIAIDLGTANTLIIHNDKVVVDQPSIVAIDRKSEKVIAVGKRAQQMHGKSHDGIKTIRPLKDGVIADFGASEQMIRELVRSIPNLRNKFFSPSLRMVICIPSGITQVEERAVKDSAEQIGAKEVYLIHEPMAAAIGIGIDVLEPKGNMIIDIGGGTTEIAVLALGGIVCDKSIKVAGDVFTSDIVYYMRTQHNLYVGERTAEKIKIHVGSALEELESRPEDYPVQGRDLMTGVAAGTLVSVMLGSANTDEAAWDDVDEVDFDRSVNKHLAFGGGVHRCLGSHLARMELRVALEEWHARIPDYRLADGAELLYSPNLRQVDDLPLVW